MGNRFSSQSLILVGCTLFVLYLAGIPLVMLLYGSIRSAPIGEPGATFHYCELHQGVHRQGILSSLTEFRLLRDWHLHADIFNRHFSRLGQ